MTIAEDTRREAGTPPQSGVFFNSNPTHQYENGESIYPFHSHLIGSTTLKFYNQNRDLIKDGKAAVAQLGWNDESGLVPINSEGSETLTVSLNAEKYEEAAKLRVTDKGEHYDGPGVFGWQFTQVGPNKRVVKGMEICGSVFRALPMATYDHAGRLARIDQVDEIQLYDIWNRITSVLGSDLFKNSIRERRGLGPEKPVGPQSFQLSFAGIERPSPVPENPIVSQHGSGRTFPEIWVDLDKLSMPITGKGLTYEGYLDTYDARFNIRALIEASKQKELVVA